LPSSACRCLPAIYGCGRNHGETPSQVVLLAQGLVEAAVLQLFVAVDTSGVDTQQHGDAMSGPPGGLRRHRWCARRRALRWGARPARAQRASQPSQINQAHPDTASAAQGRLPRLPIVPLAGTASLGRPPDVASRWLRQPRRGTPLAWIRRLRGRTEECTKSGARQEFACVAWLATSEPSEAVRMGRVVPVTGRRSGPWARPPR
jgi:hypothetical protein